MFPWTKESISDALNNGISNEEIDKAASGKTMTFLSIQSL